MFNKLKQFNDLRKKAHTIKSKLAEEEITIEHRGIKLVMDGNQEVKEVTIEQSYFAHEKKGALEHAMKDAMNEAVKKVQRVMAQKMRDMGELNIPGLS